MKDEIKEILDNIQEVINDSIKNNYYDLTINRLALSNIKNKLENYITNLQEENEHLQKQNKGLNNLIIQHIDEEDNLIDYKSRNEKAIEYIEKYLYEHIIDDLPDEESKFETEDGIPIPNAKEQLLNILNGGSNE